ncbi:MAG: hypothetical protein HQL51_07920 [Magnetococcales bacterium]|nr:hypothetical protein [Magnetococcales bacterium]
MSNAGCKPNGSGGDQPYDERGRYAGCGGCGSGGSGGSGGPGSAGGKEGSDAPDAPWWMKHLNLAPNGFPTFNYWDAGQEGMTLAESEKAMALKESLLQSWFDAAWARDGIALLREHGLLPEGVTAAGLITPLDAVLQAILAFLEGLPSLSLIGEAGAAEAAPEELPTPEFPSALNRLMSRSEWDRFSGILNQIPGMDAILKEAMMPTIGFEGGSTVNREVVMGLSPRTVADPDVRNRLSAEIWKKAPSQMEDLERVKVMIAKLDANLKDAGGLRAIRNQFTHPKLLAVVLDSLYQHGPVGGAQMLRGVADVFHGRAEVVTNDYLSANTATELKALFEDPSTQHAMMNNIFARRSLWAELNYPEMTRGLMNRFYSFTL